MNQLLKNKIRGVLVLFLAIFVMIGTSYAWLRVTLKSEKTNTVVVGNLQLELGDKTSEGIHMEYAIPTPDQKGLELEGYNFSVTNHGNINSRYTVYLDDLPIEDESLRLPDQKVKYVVIKNGEMSEAKLVSTMGKNPKRRVDMGMIAPGEENHYTLKLWIDYDAGNEVMGKIFSASIRIEAYQEEVDEEEDITKEKEVEVDLDNEEKKKIDLGDKDPSDYEFISSDLSKVEVNEEGDITPKNPGEVVVTIVNKETGNKEEINIVVTKTLTITYHKNELVESTSKQTDSCKIGRKNVMSCEVTAPEIFPKEGYTVVGWNENSLDQIGILPNEKITLTDDKQMYTIVKKEAKTLKATFHLNGAKSLDGIPQDIERSCVIDEVYQEGIQKTSCDIKVPVIEADQNTTPTVVGYHEDKNAIVTSIMGDTLTLTENKEYYAITKKDSEEIYVTYHLNGAKSFTIGDHEYLEDHNERVCRTEVVYNGNHPKMCSFDVAVIHASKQTNEVVGWSDSPTNLEVIYHSGSKDQEIGRNIELYAQTKSSEKNYVVKDYQAGSNVVRVGEKTSENSSCHIPATYNGEKQSESCTVTPPEVEVKVGYEMIGWDIEEDANSGMDPIILNSSNTGKVWYANAYYGSYTINYYDGDTLIASEGFQSGQNKHLSSIKKLGQKEGFSFLGWAITNQGEVKYQDQESIKKIPVGKDHVVNLYAVYIDDIAPVCSFHKLEQMTIGEEQELILTCKDPGSGLPYKELTNDHFTISSETGMIKDISNPIEIENGYQYGITIVGQTTGDFSIGLNPNTMVDHLGNVNQDSITQNINIVGKMFTATFTLQSEGLKPLTTTSKSCTTQGSSKTCHITLPELEVEEGLENDYTIIGWNTNLQAREGTAPNTEIELNANQIFYSISKKNPRQIQVKFHKNGADTLDSSHDEMIVRSCEIGEIYNNEVENDSCLIDIPVIHPSIHTPEVLGYAKKNDAETGILNLENKEVKLPFRKNEEYYAITKKEEVIYQAHFISQSAGVTNIEEVDRSCKIEATYNGEKQEESCLINAPEITVSNGFTAIGWNEDRNATTSVVENEKLRLIKDTNYYTIVRQDAKTLTATFHINGAKTLDGESQDVERSCTLEETYNNNTQELSCNLVTPEIIGTEATKEVLGYADSEDAIIARIPHKESITISSNLDYYAITTNSSKEITVTFYKNGAVSLDENSDEYQEKSCTILQTYNGEEQQKSCRITSPTIQPSKNTPTVIGFSREMNHHQNDWSENEEKEVSTNTYFYAQTKKNKVTHTSGGFQLGDDEGVEEITSTDPVQCEIGEVYNGQMQATSCTIDSGNLPTITPKPGYHIVGWIPEGGNPSDARPNITLDEDGKTYYPITVKNSYVIKYYDGDMEKGSTAVEVGESIVLANQEALGLTKNGYHLKGWTKTKGSQTVEYQSQEEVRDLTLEEGAIIQLYAVWVDDIGPICTFAGEGNMNIGDPKELTLTCIDQGVGIPSKNLTLENFTPTNGTVTHISDPISVTDGFQYKVVVSADGSGHFGLLFHAGSVMDHLGNTNQEIASNDMLVNGKRFIATFTKQGGVTEIGSTTLSCTTTGNNTCTVRAPSMTVGDDYTAVGWNINRNATDGIEEGEYLTLNSDATYYSISYQNEKVYSIKWDGNGAGLSRTNTDCIIEKAYNGDVQALSCTVTTPTISREGYTIFGYHKDQNSTVGDSAIPVGGVMNIDTSNTGSTYYAISSLVVTASFHKNGADTIGSTSKSCTIQNDAVDCSIIAPTITRSGYDIIGWNSNSDAEESTWDIGESKKMNSDVNYYAITRSKSASYLNANIEKAYTYNEDSSASNYCITGEESTCQEMTEEANCFKNKTEGSCPMGTIVKYKVNNNNIKYFNIIHDDGETITLQQRENTIYSTPWYSSNHDNTKGPLTVLSKLEESTKDWINVNNQTYTMGNTNFNGTNSYTGCRSYPSLLCEINTYTLEQRITKARMITVQESVSLGCDVDSSCSCPKFMSNYLYLSTGGCDGTVNDDYVENGGDHNWGYWTMSATSMGDLTQAWNVSRLGGLNNTNGTMTLFGARAIVVINK